MVTLQSPGQDKPCAGNGNRPFPQYQGSAHGTCLDVQTAALPFTFKAISPFTVKATLMGSAVTLQAGEKTAQNTPPLAIYIIWDIRTHTFQECAACAESLPCIQPAGIRPERNNRRKKSRAGKEGSLLTGTGLDAAGKSKTIILYTIPPWMMPTGQSICKQQEQRIHLPL